MTFITLRGSAGQSGHLDSKYIISEPFLLNRYYLYNHNHQCQRQTFTFKCYIENTFVRLPIRSSNLYISLNDITNMICDDIIRMCCTVLDYTSSSSSLMDKAWL